MSLCNRSQMKEDAEERIISVLKVSVDEVTVMHDSYYYDRR